MKPTEHFKKKTIKFVFLLFFIIVISNIDLLAKGWPSWAKHAFRSLVARKIMEQ